MWKSITKILRAQRKRASAPWLLPLSFSGVPGIPFSAALLSFLFYSPMPCVPALAAPVGAG